MARGLVLRKSATPDPSASNTIALSPDGNLLIAAEYSGVTVFDVPSGAELVHRTYKQDLF